MPIKVKELALPSSAQKSLYFGNLAVVLPVFRTVLCEWFSKFRRHITPYKKD